MHGLYCLASLVLFAAPAVVSFTGTVFDAYSRQPVPYAEIALPDLGLNTLADSLGRFAFNLPADAPASSGIEVEHVGYDTRRWPAVRLVRGLKLLLSPRPIDLKGVTVTAFRSPASVERSGPTAVIDSARLEEHGTTSLAEAISMTPSITLKDYGNLATIGLRGATSEQTLVLIDGARLGTAQDNLVELTTLPQTIADRVEVVRSGTSALYGANSIGGVINIVTPTPDRLTAAATAGIGSFGTRFLRLRHGNGDGSLGYYLTANLDRSDNRFTWRDSLGAEHVRTNADLANSGIFGKATLHAGPHDGALAISLNAGERGVPGPTMFPSDSARMSDVRGLTQLRYGWQQSDQGRVDVSFYHHRFWRNYRNPDPFFPQNDTHATTVSGFEVTERWQPVDWCQALLVPELSDEQLASTSIGRPRRTSLGAAAQVGLRWRGLTLVPALRYDELRESRPLEDSSVFRNVRRAVSPRVWLGCDLSGSASLYASANRSFRAPTFNELYWPDDPWTGGNPRLAPELGAGVDFGVSGRPLPWLEYRVAGFGTRVTDLILWQSDSIGVFRPANVDTSAITGAELELAVKGRHAGVRSNMTYLVAESHGRDTPYRPRLAFNVEHWLSWRWARLGWNVRYTGSRYSDSDNTDSLPSFLLFDVGIELNPRVGPVSTSLRGGSKNLFDRSYEAVQGYPVPGRTFYTELELGI